MGKRKHLPDQPQKLVLQSPLAILLLHKFAWGKLSASECQAFALAACKSGASGDDLEKLAELGARGESPQNCHRDLVRAFFKEMCAPTPINVKCLVKVKNSMGAVEELAKEIPVILPHDWVDTLEKNGLLEQVTCSQQSLDEFWSQQNWKSNPQLQCWKPYWDSLRRTWHAFLYFCFFYTCPQSIALQPRRGPQAYPLASAWRWCPILRGGLFDGAEHEMCYLTPLHQSFAALAGSNAKNCKHSLFTQTNLGSYCWKFQEIGRQEERGLVCAGRRPGIFRFRVWVANSHEQLPLPFLQGRQLFRHDKDQVPFHRFQERCIVEGNRQKLA